MLKKEVQSPQPRQSHAFAYAYVAFWSFVASLPLSAMLFTLDRPTVVYVHGGGNIATESGFISDDRADGGIASEWRHGAEDIEWLVPISDCAYDPACNRGCVPRQHVRELSVAGRDEIDQPGELVDGPLTVWRCPLDKREDLLIWHHPGGQKSHVTVSVDAQINYTF